MVDIAGRSSRASGGAFVAVDNTFATPVYQRPLELGADAVVHSTTKYLGGHSDAVGGAVDRARRRRCTRRVRFVQNSVGAVPGPLDCFLVHRGLRTLHLRMAAHTRERARGERVAARASTASTTSAGPGFSGMVSFRHPDAVADRRRATQVFSLAESLGGVESLIEVPQAMTHQSVEGSAAAVPADLVRLSCGIEARRGPGRGPRAGDRRAGSSRVATRPMGCVGGIPYVHRRRDRRHPRWMRRIALTRHDGRPRHARRRLARARRGRSGPAAAPVAPRPRRRSWRRSPTTRSRCRRCPKKLARQGGRSRSRAPPTRRADDAAADPGLSAATDAEPTRGRLRRPCAARTRRRGGGNAVDKAIALGNGVALPPLEAPEAVKQIIEAGNGIARTPYKWGGGHGKWQDTGYDCSGSVSFVLAAAGCLTAPLASGPLMSWGEAGKGKWVTIYANDGHVFLEVAGIRFDTSGAARHRLALEQRDALHGGLRRAASRRALASFRRLGVATPWHAPSGRPINRSASSSTSLEDPPDAPLRARPRPPSRPARPRCWPRWTLRGSGLRSSSPASSSCTSRVALMGGRVAGELRAGRRRARSSG